jgi:hypothetical protein
MLRLLDPKVVGVLTATCCNPASQPDEDAALAKLRAACERVGVDPSCIQLETVTAAQSALPKVADRLNEQQKTLVKGLMALFMAHGLSVFPIIFIGGDIAFHGTTPEVDVLTRMLRASVAISKPALRSAVSSG